MENLSELDADLKALGSSVSNRFYFASYKVTPQELLGLARQQLRAKQGRPPWGLNLYQRSLLGLPLLPEDAWFTRFWGKLMMFIDLTYTTFYIPLTLALFDRYGTQSYEATVLYIIDCCTGAFFAFNMLQQLHVPVRVSASFYQLLVCYGQGIAYIYKTQGTFWLDLATTVPWLMQLVVPFLSPSPARSLASVMLLLRLLRLLRVVSLVKQLARGDLAPHSNSRLMSVGTGYMLSLVFCALATINLLACVWYLAGSTSVSGYEASSWWEAVGGRDMSEAPVWDRYLAALYFTVTTVTTTGYGDITAHNNLEMVVAILIMLAGALFMSVIIGTVAALINSTSADAKKTTLFREKVAYLDRFFNHVLIGRTLQKDVYEFYYYTYSACQQEQEEWKQVVGGLPSSLRGLLVATLLRKSCGPLMDKLAAGVPDLVLMELCSCLEREVVSPGMTLAALGSPADTLCLLRHGTLMAMRPGTLMCPEFTRFMADEATAQDMWRPPHITASHTASAAAAASSKGCCFPLKTPAHGAGLKQRPAQQQEEREQPDERDIELAAPQHPHLSTLQSSRAAADTEPMGGAAAATATAATGAAAGLAPEQDGDSSSSSMQGTRRLSMLQALQQKGQLDLLQGPCLLPAYALLPTEQQQQQQVDGNCTQEPAVLQPEAAEPLWQDCVHPVWLRTYTPCVLYTADMAVVRSLCEVCPQLQHNLTQLLQLQQH